MLRAQWRPAVASVRGRETLAQEKASGASVRRNTAGARVQASVKTLDSVWPVVVDW